MSKRTILLTISTLILINSIVTHEIRILQADFVAPKSPQVGKKQLSSKGTGTDSGYQKKENNGNSANTSNTKNTIAISDGSTSGDIMGTWPKFSKSQEKVFVDIDATNFYEYTVTNVDSYMQIQILDQNLRCWDFELRRQNTVVLIDAYNRVILAKQVTKTGAIVSLWVVEIMFDAKTCTFTVDSFPVNSIVDNEFYYFNQPWSVGEILQYDPIANWMAITKITSSDVNIYKINVGQRLNTLLIVGWSFTKRSEEIQGGNSRVLYDKKNDQLMIDQKNCRLDSQDPTIYKKFPVKLLVRQPIYPNGGTTFSMASSYFQYVSKSKTGKELTTFLYQGYGNLPIINPVSLKSSRPIIYKSDNFSYFAAITDSEIYLTTVNYNIVKQKYEVVSGLLSKTCPIIAKRTEIIKDWSDAILMVLVQNKFYLLTKSKFIVYSYCPTQWNKLYQVDCVFQTENATMSLFKQIKLYVKKEQK